MAQHFHFSQKTVQVLANDGREMVLEFNCAQIVGTRGCPSIQSAVPDVARHAGVDRRRPRGARSHHRAAVLRGCGLES